MKFLRMAGTWVPLFLAFAFAVAAYDGIYGALTWERPAVYLIGAISLFAGIWALVHMARLPNGDYPSLFMLLLIYQKIFLELVYASILGLVLHMFFPQLVAVPEPVLFALLVSSTLATSMVNWLLFFGRKHQWLDLPVDPIPFRPIWRRLRR